MKPTFFLIVIFLSVAMGASVLRAQAPAPTSAPKTPPELAFLTTQEQEQYAIVRGKALADNPGLKDEGEQLMQEAQIVLSGGTAANKEDFMKKMDAHRGKLRAAMLKEDPTVAPIFKEIDEHIAALKAKH